MVELPAPEGFFVRALLGNDELEELGELDGLEILDESVLFEGEELLEEGEALVLDSPAVADSLALDEELAGDSSAFFTLTPSVPQALNVNTPVRASDSNIEDFLTVEAFKILSIYFRRND